MAERELVRSDLFVQLFGPFVCRISGQPIPRLRTRKGQQMLALLLLRDQAPIERSWLAGVLWPDSSSEQALANLRLCLTDLRKALGREAERLQSPTGKTLMFHRDAAWVDLHAFDASVKSPSLAEKQTAVALYRGPLLEGCEEEWVMPERSARERAFLEALEQLAENARDKGELNDAERYYRRVIAVDPLHETAQRGLMEALAQRGEIVGAQQAYRDYRSFLLTHVNAQPAEETTEFYRQLPGFVRAARQNRQPAAAVPVASPTKRRLPRPLTKLVGRTAEMQAAAAALEEHRLVTLTGIGGVGKTRLAIAAADAVADRFSDGVWYVNLAPLTDADAVVRAVVTALQFSGEAERSPHDSLLTWLQPRSLLLVLDNCEHLLEASSALAVSILTECDDVRVLATSRQPFGVVGERTLRVPPLGCPVPQAKSRQPDWTPQDLMQFEAALLWTF